MLTNYFSLNGNPSKVKKQSKLMKIILANDEISDVIYYPDEFQPDMTQRKIKIKSKTFRNVSFSKTSFKNLDFTLCHFEDCLFIGSKIMNCKFIKCTFKNVNTHEIQINNTYLNPQSFKNNFNRKDILKSNIAVHLFQQLLNNSRDDEQSEMARKANFQFKCWQGRLTRSKFFYKQPYSISIHEFLYEVVSNYLFRWVFGYGLRIRNFIYTFTTIFILFFLFNMSYWKEYQMCQKDFAIRAFTCDTFNFKANFFYTAGVMTQLVDSQFQPSSDLGMCMLTIQGFSGFILLSFLITVLINRFVK